MRNALKDQVYDYEIPKYIIKSDEPWEYRPRAKIRRVLQLKFGDLVNSIIPGTISSQYSGNVNLAVARNSLLTKRIKDELNLFWTVKMAMDPSVRAKMKTLLTFATCYWGVLMTEKAIVAVWYAPNRECCVNHLFGKRHMTQKICPCQSVCLDMIMSRGITGIYRRIIKSTNMITLVGKNS